MNLKLKPVSVHARVKAAYQARFACMVQDLAGTVAEKPLVLLPATGHPVTLACSRSQLAALKLNLGIMSGVIGSW